MLTGETITEIINAEPAGFILAFSHGRVAHLTVRDQMGRPGIGIQFMRKYGLGAVSGLLGSIRNAFGGDRRKGIAAVKAGRSAKGQRDVVIATADGLLEFWNANLSLGNSLSQEINIKDEILECLGHYLPNEASNNFQFTILDFTFVPTSQQSQELVKQGDYQVTAGMLLVASSHRNITAYYLISLDILHISARVKAVYPVKCYNAPLSKSTKWRPRLCLPAPGQLAFILFETAVVLFSLAKVEESPSSQLLLERNALPDPFQDCIKFQDDAIYRVLGCAYEDSDGQNHHPACVIAAQGFGLIRVTSVAPEGLMEDPEEARITTKSKIEQAVFFGTIRQNPFDLTSTAGQELLEDEIGDAALEISDEILGSSSKYLPKMTPSLDQQMRLRAKALEDLVLHLEKHYKPLSRTTRWRLLWNAEKLAAAQAMWKIQEEIQKRQPKDREECLMQYVLLAIHEKNKTKPEATKGERDRVRHWLIHDPSRIEHFLNMLVHAFDELQKEEITDPRLLADYYREANDLWIAVYDAAFKFREDNAPLYGLGDDVIQDGVLLTGYSGLPYFWTSSQDPLHWGQVLVSKTCKFLREWWDYSGNNKQDKPPQETLLHLAHRLPGSVELLSRLFIEDTTCVKENADMTDVKKKSKAESDKTEHLRYLIMAIAPFDNMPAAIALTEKLGDTSLLVKLNLDYIKTSVRVSQAEHNPTAADLKQLEKKIKDIQDHTETYFDLFGDKWAFAHFQQMVQDGEIGLMLRGAQTEDKKQPYLTRYLQTAKRFGKVSWINDVIGEHNYLRASNTLDHVAESQELDVWSKKTELSLAKLADLAAQERGQKPVDKLVAPSMARYDDALSLLDIQDQVLAHVFPMVKDAIDAKAAYEIALDTFGKRVVGTKPSATKGLLSDSLEALLAKRTMPPESLVDLLTLLDPVEFGGPEDEDPGIVGHEFFLALQVIDAMPEAGAKSSSRRDALQRLVWRRAMVRDDWILLNETASKDDAQVEGEMSQSALFGVLVECIGEDLGSLKSPQRLWSPNEILEADLFPEVLHARFQENEREVIRADLEREEEMLKDFVDKGRLQVHFEGLISAAKDLIRKEADRAGDKAAQDVVGLAD